MHICAKYVSTYQAYRLSTPIREIREIRERNGEISLVQGVEVESEYYPFEKPMPQPKVHDSFIEYCKFEKDGKNYQLHLT